MNLRYIERNGEKVLQQQEFEQWNGQIHFGKDWQDVPVHKEPEVKKPREFTVLLSHDGTKEVLNNHHEPLPGREESVIHVTEVPVGWKLVKDENV